ncbi:MAG: hypothetical protein F2673_10690 [Actinobacteria bacterium]|nr:hypothetical protein [Actinomycetota bacterium]
MARSSGVDQRSLVRETAMALRGLRGDPTGLLVSCRRILERHPTSGALWALAARTLTATDPGQELGLFARQVDEDPTPELLYDAIPQDATVCVLGWPDLVGEAILRRGDVCVLAVDMLGEGSGFVQRLRRADVDAGVVAPAGLGAAVGAADLVLLEASAAGPGGILAVAGSRAAAAVAYCSELPVWAVVGQGRRLPGPLWSALLNRLERSADPWELDDEVVPAGTISHVVGPDGLRPGTADLDVPECPAAPELLKLVSR